MARRNKTEDKHCPAAALRRELGLAAVTIARRLDLPVKQVRKCLLQNAGFRKRDHMQIAIVTEKQVREEADRAMAAATTDEDRAAVGQRLEARLKQVGGCALTCAHCDILGPVPFINRRDEVESKNNRANDRDGGVLPWSEQDVVGCEWIEVSVYDVQSAFDLAEEEGWRDWQGECFCPACLGRIGEIMRRRAMADVFLGEE